LVCHLHHCTDDMTGVVVAVDKDDDGVCVQLWVTPGLYTHNTWPQKADRRLYGICAKASCWLEFGQG
jgi:hypothetical protein